MNETAKSTSSGSINMKDYTAPANDCVYKTPKQYPEHCSYQLPCGYCKLLMRDCPKFYVSYTTVYC